MRAPTVNHPDRETLEAGLDEIRRSPATTGVVRLIVRRPAIDAREVLAQGELDAVEGLVGDTWRTRGSSRTPDGSAHPDMQLNLMNARVVQLVARHPDRWPLAGDQLFVDLDLSVGNLPAGTRLALGSAVIEITSQPHTGCGKFARRFGLDALQFVNSPLGRDLRLRGACARVLRAGSVRVGDPILKLPA
ncbi:MAG TPA: MOSC domain-containing protein [Vicinamibacterales bacterium]|nr:MOSC domain-containing protein [Vicinamibacterales bacterium]